MPAPHDLDPPAMTEEERRGKRRFEAGFAFETNPSHTFVPKVSDPGLPVFETNTCTVCGGLARDHETDTRVFSYRWMASRPEVETTPVEHVCGEPFGHGEVCVCSCGAYVRRR